MAKDINKIKNINGKEFQIDWENIDNNDVTGIYIQEDEPFEAQDGAIWVDIDDSLTIPVSDEEAESIKTDIEYFLERATNAANSALNSANNAKISENSANKSQLNAQRYANAASESAQDANSSANNAKISEDNAKEYSESAQTSANNAANSAESAESFANSVINMTVSTESLSLDSSPTVTKTQNGDVINLKFGMPDISEHINEENPHGVSCETIGAATDEHNHTKSEITDFPSTEEWTFTLEDGTIVTKAVYVG